MTTAVQDKVTPFREVKDGKLTFNFHPGQTAAWRSVARFVAMLAGTKSGKTCFAPVWLEREIRSRGSGDYLVASATYDLFKIKLLQDFRQHFEWDLGIARYWPGYRMFELAEDLVPGKFRAESVDDSMWGRIILRSADAEAGLESGDFLAGVIDEADHPNFRRSAWEAIQRRMALRLGRLLFVTTLYHFGWMKTDIYDRARAGDRDIDVIQFDSIMNPLFPREEYERAKNTLPRWKFRLLFQGIYEKPAGLIYESFNEDVCKIKRFALSPDWPRYTGHDFGPDNTAAMWYAQDPGTGYLYAYREYHAGGMSAYDHAQKFKSLSEGENVIKRVGGAPHEEGWRESFTAAGWPISKPRERDVGLGIAAVSGWHQQDKLFVFDDLLEYLDEKGSYSWKLDDKYQPIASEIVDKSMYHLMDSERYLMLDFSPESVTAGQVAKVYAV